MQIQITKEIKNVVRVLNQIFEIENKANKIKEQNSIDRNINKLRIFFEEEYGLIMENPLGEKYSQTRTDLEASIVGEINECDELYVNEVIKPIIRLKQNEITQIIQQAVVIVGVKEKNISQKTRNTDKKMGINSICLKK